MNVETAQRLADLRRSKGFSQEGLARKLGLSRQAVSKWERAESFARYREPDLARQALWRESGRAAQSERRDRGRYRV